MNREVERKRLIELLLDHTDNAFNTSEEKRFIETTTVGEVADRLLENGVIVPPCKVGDVVWLIGNMKVYTKEEVCSRKVTSVQMLRTGELIMHFKDGCFSSESVGVFVFPTREEAEYALKLRRSVSLINGHIEE
jgi:hypothetical protein